MDTVANITSGLLERARSAPDAVAIVGPETSIGYARLDGLVWRVAQSLHDRGVRPASVAAVTFIAPLPCAITLLALARLGATCLPLPRSCGEIERRELAARAGARWQVSDRPGEFDAGVPELAIDLRGILAEMRAVDPAIMDARPSAPWQTVRGSGSTGAPKLIPVTHAQTIGRARQQNAVLGTTAESCLGSLSGFDFNTGRQMLLRAIQAGARCAVLSGPVVDAFAAATRAGVSELGMSVFHAETMLSAGLGAQLAAMERLRVVTVAGSTVSSELRRRLRDVIGERLRVHYGTNESSMLTLSGPPDVFGTEGTVGRPLPGIRIEIVDAKGRPLPNGIVGLVRVSNPLACAGYLDDEAAERRSYRDGFFYPGDLGALTEDGQLIYYGRADHMMIYNGINIYPAEIERALSAHPAVADVAVMPLWSRTHQDLPVAAVTLRPGQRIEAADLRAYAKARLGVHAPAHVSIVETIPRNELGKLIRPELTRLLQRALSPPARDT